MPTYDYQCDQCGFTDEKRHGINETPSYMCPLCYQGSGRDVAMGKKITAVPAHFKGSGWGGQKQLYQRNRNTGKIEKYKGEYKPGFKGTVPPKYT